MKLYKAYATETVTYEIGVMAESEADAIEQISIGNYSTWEGIDGEDFYIFKVELEDDLCQE